MIQDLASFFGLLCGSISVILFLLAFWERAYSKGLNDGKRDGYQEGFTDAKRYSDLWWTVAENQVDEAREQIWKKEGEERWP